MSVEDRLAEIESLIEQMRGLAREYKRLTGKPLGITGEVAEFEAARHLGLTLAEARTPGYDALWDSERLQIKGRVIEKNAKPGQRLGSIRLDHEWDAVLLVLLDEDLRATEIWKADRAAVETELAKPGSKARNERGAMAVNGFKRIGRRVWPITEIVKADQRVRGTGVQYAASRLAFKRDIIEPLSMGDVFEVSTPAGVYRFTKREFYKAFQNVVESYSYRKRGLYHYPTTPEKARRFLVGR